MVSIFRALEWLLRCKSGAGKVRLQSKNLRRELPSEIRLFQMCVAGCQVGPHPKRHRRRVAKCCTGILILMRDEVCITQIMPIPCLVEVRIETLGSLDPIYG